MMYLGMLPSYLERGMFKGQRDRTDRDDVPRYVTFLLRERYV